MHISLNEICALAFPSETKRIEYLFELFDKYTAGLFAESKKKTT